MINWYFNAMNNSVNGDIKISNIEYKFISEIVKNIEHRDSDNNIIVVNKKYELHLDKMDNFFKKLPKRLEKQENFILEYVK